MFEGCKPVMEGLLQSRNYEFLIPQKTLTEISLKKKGGGDGGPSLVPHENCVQRNHSISKKVSKKGSSPAG